MSAVSAPYGFRPLRYRDSGLATATNTLKGGIASGYNTAIGVGDPIKRLTDGTFALAAAGDAVSAIFAGMLNDDENTYRSGPDWTPGLTWVQPPLVLYTPVAGVVFAVQAVGAVAQSAIGDAADHVIGVVNTRSGRATSYLASGALAGAGASAQWKIHDLFQVAQNAWGDTYTQVEVIVNEINLGGSAGNAI